VAIRSEQDDPETRRAAKAALRRAMRAARDAMPEHERATRSAALVRQVRELTAWREATVALAFHPFGAEPDIRPLLAGPRPRVLLPRVDGSELVFVAWAPGEPLVASTFGVPEPPGPPTDPATASVAIVPGLCFDPAGNRLGYGAGFYDRALGRLAGRVTTIGVCFATELADDVPHGPDDVPVDVVVTDQGSPTARAGTSERP
jgi:5-formyltetrahydrofolate cyclo-ligase